jgi:hypothetical protein
MKRILAAIRILSASAAQAGHLDVISCTPGQYAVSDVARRPTVIPGGENC